VASLHTNDVILASKTFFADCFDCCLNKHNTNAENGFFNKTDTAVMDLQPIFLVLYGTAGLWYITMRVNAPINNF
jgi:hypothetical protein